MQNVSRAYKESMRGHIRNRGYIRATIGIFNQEAQKALVVNDAESPLLYLSNKETAFSGITPERIYATAEQDFSKLDGTRYFAPKEDSGYDIYNNGLISEDILGDIYIDFGGESFDIKGLTIDFGEFYPNEFVIETNVATRQYSEIDRGLWTTEDAWDNVYFFRIIPLGMVNGQGRLRIYRFSCGLTNTFYNDKVQSYSSKEHVSTISETVPSHDMTLTVFNYDMYYSPDNPESALAFMEIGQEVRVAFGYDVNNQGKIEWLPEKKSYLKTWKANESTATFTAVDIFDVIGNDTYYVRGQYNASGTPLYDIAVDVLEDLGVADYFIDTSLKNLMIVNPMPVVKHSAALQIIANAGRCVLKEGRSGQIQIIASYIPDMWASANNEAEWSQVENVLKNDVKDGYANASMDFSVVDGTLLFIPDNPEEYRNTGYISESMWIENKDTELVQRLSFRLGSKPIKFPLGGYWVGEKPEITITMEATYTAFGLSISFRNTAPQIFHIQTYHEDEVLQFIRVENPDLQWHTDETFLEFDRMVITFDEGYPNSRIFVDNIMVGDNTDYDLMRDRDLNTAPIAVRQRKIQKISMAYTTYRQTTQRATVASEKIEVPQNKYEYMVSFNKPATGLSIVISGVSSSVRAVIVESGTYYAKIRFTGITSSVNLTYTISGYLYDAESYSYKKNYNQNGEVITWNNPLVGTREHAQILEEWLSEYYLGDVEYDIDWKGDPAVDANDLFHLETKVGKSFIRSYENNLTFNGRWKGRMKARKVAR